jgi:hypothetical protein
MHSRRRPAMSVCGQTRRLFPFRRSSLSAGPRARGFGPRRRPLALERPLRTRVIRALRVGGFISWRQTRRRGPNLRRLASDGLTRPSTSSTDRTGPGQSSRTSPAPWASDRGDVSTSATRMASSSCPATGMKSGTTSNGSGTRISARGGEQKQLAPGEEHAEPVMSRETSTTPVGDEPRRRPCASFRRPAGDEEESRTPACADERSRRTAIFFSQRHSHHCMPLRCYFVRGGGIRTRRGRRKAGADAGVRCRGDRSVRRVPVDVCPGLPHGWPELAESIAGDRALEVESCRPTGPFHLGSQLECRAASCPVVSWKTASEVVGHGIPDQEHCPAAAVHVDELTKSLDPPNHTSAVPGADAASTRVLLAATWAGDTRFGR